MAFPASEAPLLNLLEEETVTNSHPMGASLKVTPQERQLFESRSKSVDYEAVNSLHYLGNYVRRLPISMSRMMENAHDWEHLPFIHHTSFAAIELIEAGDWGWRAKAQLPPAGEGEIVLLELLVDNARRYWATTTVAGFGEGIQIHTQATELAPSEVQVDVRFYKSEPPASADEEAFYLATLKDVYARLYDEDLGLMTGRQNALDGRKRRLAKGPDGAPQVEIHLGAVEAIDPDAPLIFETRDARYCVRRWAGAWVAHSADCPHLLGPLETTAIDAEGRVTCPWHGYRFDIRTGENIGGQCAALAPAPRIELRDGAMLAIFS